MTAPLDDALARLGLRSDADARSVRRAYAQQLKRIDQATQPHEFQALREAYELALHVASRREAEAAAQAEAQPQAPVSAETPGEPPEPPEPAGFQPADSGELAKAVFQTFAGRVSAGFKDEAEATAALQDALGDDRLLNLEARTLFELQVAHLIMNGWQPGHEFLFDPACEVFSWEKDRAHLRVFGQLGAALDAAINEKLIFFQQDPDLQLNVIRRLRETEMPSVAMRRADLPLVQAMVQRYPNWLRLVTSQSNINTWFQDLPEEASKTTATTQTQTALPLQRDWKPASTWSPWLLVLFAVFMLGKLFSNTSAPSYQPPPGLGRPQVSVPSGPPISTWPPQSTSTADPYGFGTMPMPMPTPSPTRKSYDPSPHEDAGGALQLAYIGNVTFNRRDGQLIVDEVDERSRRGTSSLRPGDRLQDCADLDKRVPLVFLLATTLCGSDKTRDPKASTITYTFSVLRKGQSVTASLTAPDSLSTAKTVAADERPLPRELASAQDFAGTPVTLQPAPPQARRPPTQEAVQIGHVTFDRRDGALVVADVGERTRYSHSTLQPGDRLLGCMSSSYHLPLVHPAEARNCVATNVTKPEGGVTPYLFRVLRNGESVPASLTLRAPTSEPASGPE